MKTLKTIAFLLLSSVAFAQGQDTTVVDKVKTVVKETAAAVDTNSTFRMVYKDAKEAINGLAGALKVGAEHVYTVLVRQQIVNSITNLLIYVFLLTGIYAGYNLICKAASLGNISSYSDYTDRWQFITGIVMSIIFVIGLIIVFTSTVTETITGFVNPEYGAIKDILEFVK